MSPSSSSPSATRPAATSMTRLGTMRRLDRCATHDGFLTVAAIDHPGGFFVPDAAERPDGDREVVRAKLDIIAELAPHASALLLDPTYAIGHVIAAGILPGDVGLISNIELLKETPDGLDKAPAVMPDWTPERIARIGADGVKFVFFYRPELVERTELQHRIVADLVAGCRAADLPLIVEPLWDPLDGEDVADPAVAASRARAIVSSAASFADAGADVLKVQFPGSVADAATRADAAAAAADLDDALQVPWVLLSEGVGYDDFAIQLEVAAQAGCSGFMAGRAVWGDVMRADGATAREQAIVETGRRLDRLGELVRANGRPWRERPLVADVVASLPVDWHHTYGG